MRTEIINYEKLFTKRKDGRYQANYKDAAGNWHTIADKDPERLHRRLSEINDPTPPTFAEIASHWKETAYPDYEDGTISCYNPAYKRAVDYLGERPAHEITPEEIKRQLESLNKQNYSAKTIKTQLTVYRLIFQEAIQKDGYYKFIKLNPADQVKLPKHMKAPTVREAPEDEIVDEIRRTAFSSYFGVFALFLMSNGYRRGEAKGVQIKNIDIKAGKDGEINIEKQVTHRGAMKIKAPKTDAGIRSTPILPDIKPWIVEQVKTRDPEEYLFYGADPKKPMSDHTLDRRWRHYLLEHGWVEDFPEKRKSKQGKVYIVHHYKNKLTPHVLRHGYATLLFEADVDEFTAMKLLGHKDITTTRAVYTTLRNRKQKASEQKLIDYVKAENKRANK